MERTRQSGEVLIEARGLRKHYGPIRAVDGIDFEVRRGDVLGFLGPNGAGKTTAMKMITGFLEPDEGTVRVAGHEMTGDSLAGRRHLGYLPESAPAYGEMTVTGFLDFVAEARGVEDRSAAVDRVVGMTGLSDVLHQTVETLSKGYKRRVGLAQALVHDPQVLILDEPTDGLDPNQKAMIQELLGNLSSDRCILLSTHILDEAERICNRALIISEGRILVDSTPEELIRRAPSHNVLRVSLPGATIPELQTVLEAQPWCDRVERYAETMIDVYPVDGENRLRELLAEIGDQEIHGVQLQEGRFDDLFREITKGVAA